MAVNYDSLEQVREKIDGLDRQIVGLIAERGACVSQAARFKKDSDAVRAPQRVEQVVSSAINVVSTVWLSPLIVAVTLVTPAFTLVRVVLANP